MSQTDRKDIERGERLYAGGEIQAAAAVFESVVTRSPENEEALNNLGVIAFQDGKMADAERFFLKSVSANDHYEDAVTNLIRLYKNTRQTAKADDLRRRLRSKSDPHAAENLSEAAAGPSTPAGIESQHPVHGKFRAAFHEVNITPELSDQAAVSMQGISGSPRKAGVSTNPLCMQMMMIEDERCTRLLIVTADLFGFGSEIVAAVRGFAARWGIEPAGIILNASHTHNAPGTVQNLPRCLGPYYPDYACQIAAVIQKTLPVLYAHMEPARISWSFAETRIGVNRRLRQNGRIGFGPDPKGAYDRYTPFVLVELAGKKRRVILVRHSCHPTGETGEPYVSADYPGHFRTALRRMVNLGGVMFLQGAAGSSKQTDDTQDPVAFAQSSAAAKANGEHLARAVAAKLHSPLQPVSGTICAMMETRHLPLSTPPDAETIRKLAAPSNSNLLIRDWARLLIERHPRGEYPTEQPLEMQAVRLGRELTFLTVPAEPTAELAMEIQPSTEPSQAVFLLGYTNGLSGYLATPEMMQEGGYECDGSHLAYGLPAGVQNSAMEMLRQFRDDFRRIDSGEISVPLYGRYEAHVREKKAFFVLSAGRCGTMTLAHLLDSASNARVWHHPQPDPIREALQAWHGEIDRTEAFWRFRRPFLMHSWAEGRVHGETDLLMTPFADVIADEIPDAKFIVLVRDPRDFVRSGMRRKYYQGHPWDFGRLKPGEDDSLSETWRDLSTFEKTCWLWNETYRRIVKIVRHIGDRRFRIIRMEDIIRDPDSVKGIFHFLGLEGYDVHAVREVLGKRYNAQVEGVFPRPEVWTPEQHDTLWRRCGSLARRFGYPRDYPASSSGDRRVSPDVEQGAAGDGVKPQSGTTPNPVPTGHRNANGPEGFIAGDSVITCPFSIGAYSNIMGKAVIKGNRACRIGKYCALGWGIHIVTSHHDISRANLQIAMQNRHGFNNIWTSRGDVEIGNNVWIGDNAIILSGVKIGDGAIVGAGAVVMNDVPPFSVVAGNPAHVIKMRFSEAMVSQLLQLKWWDWTEERISRNKVFFEMDLAENPDLDIFPIIEP